MSLEDIIAVFVATARKVQHVLANNAIITG
jgi:hypothetical protein